MKIGYLMQAGVPDVRVRPLSGPANHVTHVFNELRYLGHQVRLLAFMEEQIWQSDNLEDFELVSLPRLEKGPLRLFERAVRRVQSELQLPYAALFESARFAQACRQVLTGYDIFYERMGWVGYGGAMAAHWLKTPLVLEVNGDHLSELELLGIMPKGLQLQLSVSMMRRALQKVSHVVATGEGWRQRFIDRWGITSNKVTVIENGSEVVNLLTREQLRAFSPQSISGQINIIYIGAVEPWHGLAVLVKAVAKAVAKGVLLQLTLVGSGSSYDSIERLILELGIAERVVLCGHLDIQQIIGHLAESDIGVSPYCGRVEYSGLKLLDYKSAGLAVIASGENGQPAILEHGYTGWIVPPCDEDALCQAIVELANDDDLRRKIGQQARIEAENHHGWQYTVKKLEELFIKVGKTNSASN